MNFIQKNSFKNNISDHLFPDKKLDDYKNIASPTVLEEIKKEAFKLQGKTIIRCSAVSQGGGVAEMIPLFAGLMNNLGIKTHWLTMEHSVSPIFFGITSGLHYALQDSKKKWVVYENPISEVVERPVEKTDLDLFFSENEKFGYIIKQLQESIRGDCIVINDDPQCVASIKTAKIGKTPFFWRFHPYGDFQADVWQFLKPYIIDYDGIISTSSDYFPTDIKTDIKVEVNYPFIDPFHEKLKILSNIEINQTLEKFGIDPEKPILAQASRFDFDKDPLGVIEVFRLLKKNYSDLQLVYTGPFAEDNPTSTSILAKMKMQVDLLGFKPGKDVFFLHPKLEKPGPFHYKELAALWQSPKTFVVQLSIHEGFGLVVSEAAWLRKSVVGTKTGGIPFQIKHDETGYLVEPRDYTKAAEYISKLMDNPGLNNAMGEKAHEYIKNNFLISSNVLRWLKIINAR